MIYVYAITHAEAEPPPDCRGIDERPVQFLRCGELGAAVSDHASGRIERSIQAVRRHEAFIEQLMRNCTLLPARFATTFDNERHLKEIVQQNHESLSAGLERVRGCVELGVRVLLRNPMVPAPARQQAASSSGTAYMLGRLEEEQRRRDQLRDAKELAGRIHAPLAEMSIDSTSRVLPSPEILLSAAYLIPRDQVADFGRSVDQIAGRHPRVSALCTGPWPPYNFTPALKLPEAQYA